MSLAARLLTLMLAIALSSGAQAEDEPGSDVQGPEVPIRRVDPHFPLIEVTTERCQRCDLDIEFTLTPDGTVFDPALREETRCPVRLTARVLEEASDWKYDEGKGFDSPRGGYIIADETNSGRVFVACPGPCSCPCLGIDITAHGVWSEQTDQPGVWTRKTSPERILGALVDRVAESSPAALAGLQRGDLVIQFNSRRVHTPVEMLDQIDAVRPGEGFEVIALREGQHRTLSGVVGELEPRGQCAATPP